MEKHVYCYDNLIIGGSLNALLCSYTTETPIIIDEIRKPFELEIIENKFDFIGFHEESQLTVDVWERLYYLVSMGGLLMNPLTVQSWRQDEKNVTFITPNNKKIVIRGEKITTFDVKKDSACVYDWFDIKSGGKHDIDSLEDKNSNFVQKVLFFYSKRANVQATKDAVSLSYLPSEKIEEIKYAEGASRLKTLKMMKEAGMRGTKNGFYAPGKRRYHALKIEHSYREIIYNYKYYKTIDEILKLYKKEGRLWNLTKNLFGTKVDFI